MYSQTSTHLYLPVIVLHFRNIPAVAQEHFLSDNCHTSSLSATYYSSNLLFLSQSLSPNSFICMTIFKSTKIKMFRIQFPFWFYKMKLQLVGNTKPYIAGFSAHWLKFKSCTVQGHFVPQAKDLSFHYKIFHFLTHWKWSSSFWSSKDSRLLKLITYYLNLNS